VLFNFSNFFFYYKAFFYYQKCVKNISIKIIKILTSGFTNASALYSSQRVSKASTLSQVDIADSISDDYPNKSNTWQNSINISNLVSSPRVSSQIQEKLNFYRQKAVVFNTENQLEFI